VRGTAFQAVMMIAAPVQCDVDGISEGSYYTRAPPMGYTGKVSPLQARSHSRNA